LKQKYPPHQTKKPTTSKCGTPPPPHPPQHTPMWWGLVWGRCFHPPTPPPHKTPPPPHPPPQNPPPPPPLGRTELRISHDPGREGEPANHPLPVSRVNGEGLHVTKRTRICLGGAAGNGMLGGMVRLRGVERRGKKGDD